MPNLLSALFAWLAGPSRARAADGVAAFDARPDSGPPAAETDAADTGPASTPSSVASSDDTLAAGSSVAGWFGKMPSLGDFASRRLPDVFVAKWDVWLSESLEAAAEALGERFDAVYGAAPPWRFLLAPGVIDPRAWIGVVVPSSDRVGRQFPLTIVAACQRVPAPLAAVEPWWEGAVSAALACRTQGATVETFDEALVQLGAPAFDAPPSSEHGSIVARVPAAGGFESALGRTMPWLLPACGSTSFWWLHNESGSAPLVVVRGLPEAASFARLLDGSL